MKKRSLSAALVVAAVLVASQPAAHAHDRLRGYGEDAPTTHPNGSGGCTAADTAGVLELGRSGTTRLRIQWQLRGVHDINAHFPTYAKTGWAYSSVFPNDHLSYYFQGWLPRGIVSWPGQNSAYALWTKMVGERPSFWQRDLVIKVRQGQVGGCADDGSLLQPGFGGGPST